MKLSIRMVAAVASLGCAGGTVTITDDSDSFVASDTDRYTDETDDALDEDTDRLGEIPPGTNLATTTLGAARFVPGGEFVVGCVPGRDDAGEGCFAPESPSHTVTLSHGFWMMEAEVSQSQWSAFDFADPSHFSTCGPACPVEQVSWWDAVSVANAASVAENLDACYELSGCTGTVGVDLVCDEVQSTTVSGSVYDCEGWRLPTEAEWERAARADDEFAYSGADDPDDVAWYSPNSGDGTHTSCGKARNAWSFCDMSGNVAEWVWDWYDAYGPDDAADPAGTASGTGRVVKGGKWDNDARNVRTAVRGNASPTYAYRGIGVRLVRSER